MSNKLDYETDHYCPVYDRVINVDLCYDSLMSLNRGFRIDSTKELSEIKDIEHAREVCANCQYSNLD